MNVIYEEIKQPEDRSPIFYCDIKYTIRTRSKVETFNVNGIVVKGAFHEIKIDEDIKKRILREHFKGPTNVNKRIKDFDLNRLKIVGIHMKHFMGYGVKRQKKS